MYGKTFLTSPVKIAVQSVRLDFDAQKMEVIVDFYVGHVPATMEETLEDGTVQTVEGYEAYGFREALKLDVMTKEDLEAYLTSYWTEKYEPMAVALQDLESMQSLVIQ